MSLSKSIIRNLLGAQILGFALTLSSCGDDAKTLNLSKVSPRCGAKEEEITKAAGQRDGDVEAALALAQEDERKAAEAELAAKEEAKRAKEQLDETLQEVASRTKLLTVLADMFDKSYSDLESQSQIFFANSKNAEAKLAGLEGKLKDSDKSVASLKALLDEAVSSLQVVRPTVCLGQSFEMDILSLRSQIAHMNSVVDGLEKRLSSLELPKEFAKDKDQLSAQVNQLRQIPIMRDGIFNSSFDLLLDRPYVCEKFNLFTTELSKAVQLAKRSEDVKATVGVTADFKSALERAEKEAAAIAAIESVTNLASEIEADLMAAIYKGEVTKAKLIADRFDLDMEAALNRVRESNPTIDLIRTSDAFKPIKSRIQFVVESRLNLAAAAILVNGRLRVLATKIMRLAMRSNSDPELATVWNSRKNEILTSLNTKVGQDIPRPELNDWASISAYETQLVAIEATLDHLASSTKP